MSFPITREEVLAIERPEDLFPGDLDRAKELYRGLAKRWHPDHGGDNEVFARITALYDKTVTDRKLLFGRCAVQGELLGVGFIFCGFAPLSARQPLFPAFLAAVVKGGQFLIMAASGKASASDTATN